MYSAKVQMYYSYSNMYLWQEVYDIHTKNQRLLDTLSLNYLVSEDWSSRCNHWVDLIKRTEFCKKNLKMLRIRVKCLPTSDVVILNKEDRLGWVELLQPMFQIRIFKYLNAWVLKTVFDYEERIGHYNSDHSSYSVGYSYWSRRVVDGNWRLASRISLLQNIWEWE